MSVPALAPPTVYGSGPHKVLALHGWFGHAGAWGPMVEHIDPARFTLAFVDNRGYGKNIGVTGSYTVEEIVADAMAAATALGWERYAVLGHSMGGMFAQLLAARDAGRVSAVVGLCAVPASGYPFDEASWGFFASAAASAEVRYAILDLTTGKRLGATFLSALLRSSLAHSTEAAFAGALVAWGRTDFSAELADVRVPVHIFAGQHDPAVGIALLEGTTQRHLPQAEVEVLANSGHYPMFEVPVFLAARLESLLAV